MASTKAEMQAELMQFMKGFVSSFERMYWIANNPHFKTAFEDFARAENIKKSTLWLTANAMYDYGILGIPHDAFGKDKTIDAQFADVELFIRGLDSLSLYFQEDDVSLPHITRKVVRTAVARHVLEGGERYTSFGELEEYAGDGSFDALSLQELALLADMDERSVRNAASQRQFATFQHRNKRTMVEVTEALRWLTGRKGFVPTQHVEKSAESSRPEAKTASLSLPSNVIELLELKARQMEMPVAEFIENKLFDL